MKIVFFNHYHNGDIFASKGYISDLIQTLHGYEFIYQHFHSPKLLNDLNIGYKSLNNPLGNISDRTPFLIENDTIFINTWIGNYLHLGDGINWNTYHRMFKLIYNYLSESTDIPIELDNKEYYVPSIDYSYFDIPDIQIPDASIIISNGPVMSGQSSLADLNSVISYVLNNTDSYVFLTHFAPFNHDNVFYTNNIINTKNGDLNEISWIASQCKILIGRNSGPFCFMHTKDILFDSEKNIVSIGNNSRDSFIYDFPIGARYTFIDDSNSQLDLGTIL